MTEQHVMGISFGQDMRNAGYRPAIFKNALLGFMRTQSPGWTDEAHKLFPHYPDKLRVVDNGRTLNGYPWIPKHLKKQ
jgi:hypothetical protein